MTHTIAPAETVADIYAAFGAGDVPRILDRLSEDVEWDVWPDNHAERANVALLTGGRGRDHVAAFFGTLATCTVEHFAVLDVLASATQAVAHIDIDLVLPGGGRFRDQELHLWTFGPDGRVVAFRHFLDTAKMIAAAREDRTARQ